MVVLVVVVGDIDKMIMAAIAYSAHRPSMSRPGTLTQSILI